MKTTKRSYNAATTVENLPIDVRRHFAAKHRAGIDMDITFAIWQAMILNLSGGLLPEREHFNRAWRMWEQRPRDNPFMTMIVDAEESLTEAIMALERGAEMAA